MDGFEPLLPSGIISGARKAECSFAALASLKIVLQEVTQTSMMRILKLSTTCLEFVYSRVRRSQPVVILDSTNTPAIPAVESRLYSAIQTSRSHRTLAVAILGSDCTSDRYDLRIRSHSGHVDLKVQAFILPFVS
jgi:hypothetical protein